VNLLRFEKKIIGAVVLAALGPLIGALVVGYQVLGDAYGVGVNQEVHQRLQEGVTARRELILALREEARATVNAVGQASELSRMLLAQDWPQVEAHLDSQLERYDVIAALKVLREDEVLVERTASHRLDESVYRLNQTEVPMPEEAEAAGFRLESTIVIPAAVIRDYQMAGEFEEMYARIRGGSGVISGLFLTVYLFFLLSVIVVIMGAAVVISRRVTKRVAVLRAATKNVAEGDFSVQVPLRSDDEVAELTESFNLMVREMDRSRRRIDFLQQISAWQDFARRLAHEIKNPLTPIQLAIQDVTENYGGEDEAHRARLNEVRDIIEEEVRTLRRLVGEFSDFARMPQAELQNHDLVGLLGELEKSSSAILADVPRSDDIEIALRCELDECWISADSSMLRRALRNLVENAVQAQAGEPGRVEVRLSAEHGFAIVEVHDAGGGVSAEARQRIFDPYYTTKQSGTGLGLSIVKKIILEHRAEISCAESPLGGACFRVRIPLV